MDLLIGYTGVSGYIRPETFVFTTNGSTPTLVINSGTCMAWTITGNQSTSPSVIGGLNSVHTISSITPFTTLTINSPNNYGNGGSSFALCNESIVVPCEPYVDLGADTTLCQGETLTLDANTSNATYLWQDNSTNPTLNVTQQGTYWVEVTNSCGTTSDTINVNYNPTPTINVGNDTTLCQGDTLTLDANTSNATYLWQDNSTNPAFNVIQQETYWVEVTVNNCSTTDTINIYLEDCNCILYIPNSFTPNFDNRNDKFSPISECDFKEYSFRIFNRWGEKIFETNNYYDSWDGTYHGRLCQIGVYVYLLRYKYDSGYEQKYGHVTLLK
jgi:gliding motility-associated-like protein